MPDTTATDAASPQPLGPEQKACRQCFKPIDARAKRCPFCQGVQTRQTLGWVKAVLMLVILAPAILIMWQAGSMSVMFKNRPTFATGGAGLQVVDSKLSLTNSDWIVIGTLRNSTRTAWHQIQCEIQFFDEDGKMIDAEEWNLGNTVSPSGGASTVRFHNRLLRSKDYYVSHKVRIVTAESKLP